MNLLFLALSLSFAFASTTVDAAATKSTSETNKSALQIADARVFTPLKGSSATAGYAKITNPTNKDISLTVKTAEKFKAAELHESYEKDGRMRMKRVASLNIPANSTIELKPGGLHIMLFDAESTMKDGDKVMISFLAGEKNLSTSFTLVPRMGKGHKHQH